jgi:hypothetical protein
VDTENPHPSAFRELMSAAGYKTGTALARDLRLPNTTVYGWITGKRLPENVGRCSYVAEFFSSKTGIPLTPARLLELFRKGTLDNLSPTLDNLSPTLDNLSPTLAKGLNRHGALTGLSEGDPCPRGHGCNGTIVLPTDGAARTWWVKLTCKTCPETWTVAIGDYHGQYCPKCLATPRSELDEILKRRACTVRDCAQAIGYPLRTVDGWAAGGHPPENLERLQSLCAFVETPLEEAGATIAIPGSGYTLFWKQTVGDPCPNPKHGASCRGVLTPPVDPKAQYLDIMIPCLDCGTPIFHRGENRYQHHDSQYCRDHGIKHRRKPR